jgi:hypothetical protein
MSGGSCTGRLSTPGGGASGGSRFSRMYIIATISSRQTARGRISGGGNAWHPPQVARACCSSAGTDGGGCACRGAATIADDEYRSSASTAAPKRAARMQAAAVTMRHAGRGIEAMCRDASTSAPSSQLPAASFQLPVPSFQLTARRPEAGSGKLVAGSCFSPIQWRDP